jgi:hypothetical protein
VLLCSWEGSVLRTSTCLQHPPNARSQPACELERQSSTIECHCILDWLICGKDEMDAGRSHSRGNWQQTICYNRLGQLAKLMESDPPVPPVVLNLLPLFSLYFNSSSSPRPLLVRRTDEGIVELHTQVMLFCIGQNSQIQVGMFRRDKESPEGPADIGSATPGFEVQSTRQLPFYANHGTKMMWPYLNHSTTLKRDP